MRVGDDDAAGVNVRQLSEALDQWLRLLIHQVDGVEENEDETSVDETSVDERSVCRTRLRISLDRFNDNDIRQQRGCTPVALSWRAVPHMRW